MQSFVRGTIVLALMLFLWASPTWAQSAIIFVQFGDGGVVAVPSDIANDWVSSGQAVIVQTVPAGYVLEPAVYYYAGYPTYYPVGYHPDYRHYGRPFSDNPEDNYNDYPLYGDPEGRQTPSYHPNGPFDQM